MNFKKWWDLLDSLRLGKYEVEPPQPAVPAWPFSPSKRGCHVCGMGKDKEVTSYVCTRPDCPSKVTCGGGL